METVVEELAGTAAEEEEVAGAAAGRGFRVGDGGFFRWAGCCEGSEASVFAFWDWRATFTRVGLLAP